jgi:hypothetical protein
MELDNEIGTLKQRLQELESMKKSIQEYNDRTDINKNLGIIKQGIVSREDKINRNEYAKIGTAAKFIDRDMIPQLQAIYNILQTFNERIEKLDILSENIKSERDELEKKKLKFEIEKKTFDQSKVEVDIKNTKLSNDIINKEIITINNVQLSTTKLYEYGRGLSKEYAIDIWILDMINEMFYYISQQHYDMAQKIKIDINLPKSSQIENIKKENNFGRASLFDSENIIINYKNNDIRLSDWTRGHICSRIRSLFPQCNTKQQMKPI